MAWTYKQATGLLSHRSCKDCQGEGCAVGTGYSGHGPGKNNPALEAVGDDGPIPRGTYWIGPPETTAKHGPYVLRLTSAPLTDTFGRDGFLIHGDSIQQPGTASHGCIILARPLREQIWDSGDRILEVV